MHARAAADRVGLSVFDVEIADRFGIELELVRLVLFAPAFRRVAHRRSPFLGSAASVDRGGFAAARGSIRYTIDVANRLAVARVCHVGHYAAAYPVRVLFARVEVLDGLGVEIKFVRLALLVPWIAHVVPFPGAAAQFGFIESVPLVEQPPRI